MVKVSIIVPVYNVKKYLTQCIQSICQQTLKDIEILCIDDGSTDGSGILLDEFAQKDGRIKVIHKENSGYGASMNIGLQNATGEYIGIVESDDKIAGNMYESLYEKAKMNDLDFVKSEAFYWYEKACYITRIHESFMDEYFDRILGDNDRNVFFSFFMNIWTGIYRRDFLSEYNIMFHESPGASYQDNGFWMQTCMYAKRVMWLNDAFYYYRQDNPEASIKNGSKMFAMTKEYQFLGEELKKRHHEYLLPYCYSMMLFRMRGTFYRIADENKLDFVDHIKTIYATYKANIRYSHIDKWIRDILRNPELFCERVTSTKKEIRERISSSNGVIIYGAGKRGDMVLRTLYNENFYDKICCFAVTRVEQSRFIADKEVLNIEEAVKRHDGATVIIATVRGTKAYCDMHNKIKALNVEKYIDATDIEENFYIL